MLYEVMQKATVLILFVCVFVCLRACACKCTFLPRASNCDTASASTRSFFAFCTRVPAVESLKDCSSPRWSMRRLSHPTSRSTPNPTILFNVGIPDGASLHGIPLTLPACPATMSASWEFPSRLISFLFVIFLSWGCSVSLNARVMSWYFVVLF